MVMRIKDGIQRLGWRFRESFKSGKGFKPNESDLEAFNTVVDFYDKQSKENTNNELMFKMYIWHRVELMKHYNADVFDDIPQKRLANALSMPLDVYINRLVTYLNDFEYQSLLKEVEINDKPFYLMSEPERKRAEEAIQDLFKKYPEKIQSLTGGIWEKQDVLENITAEFNQLLLIA